MASNLAVIEIEIPLREQEADAAIKGAFPDDMGAWQRSIFSEQMKKRKLTQFRTACELASGHVLIIHSHGALANDKGTSYDIRVEPVSGISARTAAEEMWLRINKSAGFSRGRKGPRLIRAAVGPARGEETLTGASAGAWATLRSFEFLAPIVAACVSMLVYAAFLYVVPFTKVSADSWAADGAWAIAPGIATAVVALVLAYALRPKGAIRWTIT